MHKYRLIRKLGEGTFSEVLMAEYTKTKQKVAIKCMKQHFENIEKVKNLREIKALQRLTPHPHIIQLIEVLYDEPTSRLALVFELMEMNMYEAIKGRPNYLPEKRVKGYIYQLLKAIEHMHRHGIFHRDIKPENILLRGETVKLADLGSCRGLYNKPPLTEYISTRWYRAPECLMTDGHYGYKMDIWGIGCVLFEVLSLFPLFPGENEHDQIHKIHDILGTPEKSLIDQFQKNATHMKLEFDPKKFKGISKLIPHISKDCQDVIMKMVTYNADQRWTARQVLEHPYFKDLREQDQVMSQSGVHSGLGHSISKSNLAAESMSQYSRRNSDNGSEEGSVQVSYQSKSTVKKKHSSKKTDKKKVLPKKFPELKMILSGEQRNTNNTLSSDDEKLNFPPIKKLSVQIEGSYSQSNLMQSNSYQKNKIQKRPKKMLASQHSSGNINVPINNISRAVSMGMMSTDFKSTMKHNSSNTSIQSKKMIATIKKPQEFQVYNNNNHNGSPFNPDNKKSYNSPYAFKKAAKGGNN